MVRYIDSIEPAEPYTKMSGVWGWFSGQSAQSRKDTPKNAILGLRLQLEMLQKREKHLQNQMNEQDDIARKNVATNKNGACAPCCGILKALFGGIASWHLLGTMYHFLDYYD